MVVMEAEGYNVLPDRNFIARVEQLCGRGSVRAHWRSMTQISRLRPIEDMAATEKAQQELEQIERQVAEMEVRPAPTTRPAARSRNCRSASKPCAEK